MQIPFHWYGFFIGVAMWVGISLAEKKAQRVGITQKDFWEICFVGVISGVVGARLYHVMTDFSLYVHAPFNIFKIWNGGLSIIGAVIGAGIGLSIWQRFSTRKPTLLQIADISVFGLAFAQTIGRLGNFFNQELYGLPTSLPWKMYIDPAHRFPAYAQSQYYHPLFAYEMIGTFVFGCLLWYMEKKQVWQIGSGKYCVLYIFLYSSLRFFLDFLRIDKAPLGNTGLGINQVVLLIVLLGSGLFLLHLERKKYEK